MKKLKVKLGKKMFIIIGIVLLIILLLIFIIGGVRHHVNASSPVGLTEAYFNKYIKEDNEVTSKIVYDFSDKLNTEQEKRYKEIIKKQYRNLSYHISDQYVGELDANITVEIRTIDLKSVYEKANSYIDSHKDKFLKDNEFDSVKANDYKLEQLENAKDDINYVILINFYKDDSGKWNMNNLSDADIKKIEGTF